MELKDLKIGDKVRVKEPCNGWGFKGVGIYRGLDCNNKSFHAIERLDGITGGSQNGWWSFPDSYIYNLEFVEENKKVEKKEEKVAINWNKIKSTPK